MPIELFPSEILKQILQNVLESTDSSSQDLHNCALVCKRWSYCALELLWRKPLILKPQTWVKLQKTLNSTSFTYAEYPPLIRRINLSAVSDFISDDSLSVLTVCKKLDRVTLTGCSHVTDTGIMKLLSEGVGQYLLSIDLSEIQNVTDETVYKIANSCKRLQGLNLSISAPPKEGCLGITDESIVVLAQSCRDLRRVRFSNWKNLTDKSLIELASKCSSLLEIDVINCSITNESLVQIFSKCRELRELKISSCVNISDYGFTHSALSSSSDLQHKGNYFDQLRVLDLTSVTSITDCTIDVITQAAPKIRNLTLNKCINITDKGVGYITRLDRFLHYIHLGSCRNITDDAVVYLASKCIRIRYIDLASCNKLGDRSVIALSNLSKLKRIGLVKCVGITDCAIQAFIKSSRAAVSLERIHLSYCDQITPHAISKLVVHCRRLTHLSLSFIPAFQRQEYQRYCRSPPKDYSQEMRMTFCVFSGENVTNLRNHFKVEIQKEKERARIECYLNNASYTQNEQRQLECK